MKINKINVKVEDFSSVELPNNTLHTLEQEENFKEIWYSYGKNLEGYTRGFCVMKGEDSYDVTLLNHHPQSDPLEFYTRHHLSYDELLEFSEGKSWGEGYVKKVIEAALA